MSTFDNFKSLLSKVVSEDFKDVKNKNAFFDASSIPLNPELEEIQDELTSKFQKYLITPEDDGKGKSKPPMFTDSKGSGCTLSLVSGGKKGEMSLKVKLLLPSEDASKKDELVESKIQHFISKVSPLEFSSIGEITGSKIEDLADTSNWTYYYFTPKATASNPKPKTIYFIEFVSPTFDAANIEKETTHFKKIDPKDTEIAPEVKDDEPQKDNGPEGQVDKINTAGVKDSDFEPKKPGVLNRLKSLTRKGNRGQFKLNRKERPITTPPPVSTNPLDKYRNKPNLNLGGKTVNPNQPSQPSQPVNPMDKFRNKPNLRLNGKMVNPNQPRLTQPTPNANFYRQQNKSNPIPQPNKKFDKSGGINNNKNQSALDRHMAMLDRGKEKKQGTALGRLLKRFKK